MAGEVHAAAERYFCGKGAPGPLSGESSMRSVPAFSTAP